MEHWNTYRDEILNDVEYFSEMVAVVLEECSEANWKFQPSQYHSWPTVYFTKPIAPMVRIRFMSMLNPELDGMDPYFNGRWEITKFPQDGVFDYYGLNTKLASFKPFAQKYDLPEFRRLFRNFIRNAELEAKRRHKRKQDDKIS